ncbi:MAG: TAXI family TRAP transporter solute-binding subunit [Thermoanaerobaculia bacterium]|nr:TAXI family TRAP transporter solute-binding subunit [Thermoanaerobaculia bacterium]
MIQRATTALGLALLLFAGCGGGPEGSDGNAGEGRRRFLSIGTAPPGGAFFVVGGALAEVLDQYGQPGWQVTAEATKGTQENIRRLDRGELDFALANAAISYFFVRGEGEAGRPHAIRTVMTLAPNVALFLTPASSPVSTLADMRGRRICIGPAGAGFEYFVGPILEAHGLGYGDFEVVNATQSGAVDLLADGSVAAAFLGGAVPTASITQATASQEIRFVPYEERAMTSLVERYPFFDRAVIPAGTYRGQKTEIAALNVGSMHLITGAGVSEELVYQVTRTLWENRERVAEKHPAGRAINPRVAVRDTGTEFHPGAVRFYREIGIWPEAEASP